MELGPESAAAPGSIVGEFHALRALAHAAAEDSTAARRDAAIANGFTRALEPSRYADFAEAILSLSYIDGDRATERRVLQSVRATASAEFAHALVLVVRLRPDILTFIQSDPQIRAFAVDAFVRSGDTVVAAKLEPDLRRSKHRAGSLTSREAEVLALLGESCTNADIARRLVIATSTAKVHVRHILHKLGARNRVQAALLSRDVLRDVNRTH